MQYKIYINGDAYRPVKTDVAYRPLIYRAVSIILTVKMPDGSVLESKQVEINGSNHMTNANGQITLTDDMGTSTTYRVKYSDIYYTDVDVTYTKDATYDVKLEQHVAAGSVSVGVTAGKSYTLYGRWIKDAVIAWSDEINTNKADVTI